MLGQLIDTHTDKICQLRQTGRLIKRQTKHTLSGVLILVEQIAVPIA